MSIVLHAAVLGWALISFAAAPPFDSPPASDPIDVELLPPTQTSQPKLGSKTGKPADQITPKDTKASAKESDGQRVGDTKTEEPPPPPPPEQKPTPPVEKPPQVAAVPPPPPPTPEPPKPDPPKPVAKVEPTPPAPTPPPPKPDLPKEAEKAKDVGEGKPPEVKEPPKDQKALEKLLEEAKKPDPKPPEKKPDPKPAEKPALKPAPIKTAAIDPKQAKSTTQSASNGQLSDINNHVDTGLSSSKLQKQASLGSPTGPTTNLKLSQSEMEGLIGALKSQITPCWNPPAGASESGVKVTLAISLNSDGTLNAENIVAVSPVSNPLASSIASSAMRAVKMCASQKPFTLPADKYGAWALNHVTFDPKYQ